jgi:uncharacterized SAM-binding protein YcdF (DUF218 family)
MQQSTASAWRGRRWGRVVAVLVVLAVAGWLFRFPLLRALGDRLIVPDPLVHADAVYMLGGAPLERGIATARLVNEGYAPKAVSIGEIINSTLQLQGIALNDAALGRQVLEGCGVPPERIEELPIGSSTWEEAGAILDHATTHGHDTIIIVSTDFHLRRIKRVFRKRLEGRPVTVVLRPAASLNYDPARWWESEEGLLMVNNEYVKSMYYWLKY